MFRRRCTDLLDGLEFVYVLLIERAEGIAENEAKLPDSWIFQIINNQGKTAHIARSHSKAILSSEDCRFVFRILCATL
jgi:hypothetical protein